MQGLKVVTDIIASASERSKTVVGLEILLPLGAAFLLIGVLGFSAGLRYFGLIV